MLTKKFILKIARSKYSGGRPPKSRFVFVRFDQIGQRPKIFSKTRPPFLPTEEPSYPPTKKPRYNRPRKTKRGHGAPK